MMRKPTLGGAVKEGRVVLATAGLKEWCQAAGVFLPNWSGGFVVRVGGQGSVCISQIRHSSEIPSPIAPYPQMWP